MNVNCSYTVAYEVLTLENVPKITKFKHKMLQTIQILHQNLYTLLNNFLVTQTTVFSDMCLQKSHYTTGQSWLSGP